MTSRAQRLFLAILFVIIILNPVSAQDYKLGKLNDQFSADEVARPYFEKLCILADSLQQQGLFFDNKKVELSMGMSHDYHIAIDEGATYIRIGTAIFGQRPLKK